MKKAVNQPDIDLFAFQMPTVLDKSAGQNKIITADWQSKRIIEYEYNGRFKSIKDMRNIQMNWAWEKQSLPINWAQKTLKFISKCMKFDYRTQIFHDEDLGTLDNAAWLSLSLPISNQVSLEHLFRQDYDQNKIVDSISRVRSFAFASSPASHIFFLRSLCHPMD